MISSGRLIKSDPRRLPTRRPWKQQRPRHHGLEPDVKCGPSDQRAHNTGSVCLIHEEIVAGEMSLSKPFLKETKTNSLFCLRSEVLSK